VLVAIRWSDEAEAIRMANDSHYGRAADERPPMVMRKLKRKRPTLKTAHEHLAGINS
jgi:hypothetical protein